ncbi:N-acetylmuramoyl-L-alanine amidase [candidate division KSB1 bacterium]|nr:N-acetylmuramoyl-L-alanine amidase [candidate division KSB1 bacterium]
MQIEWIESQFFHTDKIANEMIIIHHTGSNNGRINSLQGTISWFKPDVWRSTRQVSAQYIIARDLRPIIQMVKDEHTAWHAGRSSWEINGVLRENLNNRSIGIELQGDGQLFRYSDFQYDALIWLVKQKMEQFNIPIELVRGHEEITPRKPDPGQLFDWDRLKQGLASVTAPGSDIPAFDDSLDTDGDGIIYLDETDDVKLPSGKDRTIVESILDFFAGLFK